MSAPAQVDGFTLPQDREAAYAVIVMYHRGVREGIRRWAWWKSGVQYVGSCGTTLATALDQSYREEDADLRANGFNGLTLAVKP